MNSRLVLFEDLSAISRIRENPAKTAAAPFVPSIFLPLHLFAHSAYQALRGFARMLRNEATLVERLLWNSLRTGGQGVKFRREAAIGPFIVDFVCFSHELVIELDGPQHLEPEAIEYDARRSAWLAANGFRVIRFPNEMLDDDVQQVVDLIRKELPADSGNQVRAAST
jgi:very-short-patch-repair endonuclease